MNRTFTIAILAVTLTHAGVGADPAPRRLSRAELRDKIQGAWAGQMIGVAYGAKTEFRAKGVMFEAEIKPEPLSNAIGQDDLYVEMTFARVPESYRSELATLADRKFQFTDYSFNEIVQSTERRALAVIRRAGGKVSDTEVVIPRQPPRAPALEQCNFGKPVKLAEPDDAGWTWRGEWRTEKETRMSAGAGSAAELRFKPTGLALVGPMSQQGGRADVFVDGRKLELVADAYVGAGINDSDLWRVFELAPGEHTLRLVTRADADPQSKGRAIGLRRAVIYAASGARR